jgi:hypothetical protein
MIPNLKIYLYAGVALTIGLAGFYLRHHWIQEGLARQRAADASALAQAAEAASRKEEEWRKKYDDAQGKYESEVAANHVQPPLPPVWVRRPERGSCSLPTAAAGPTGPAAVTGSLPGGGEVPSGGYDLGPGLEMLARSADAVVAQCRRLVDSVRGEPP